MKPFMPTARCKATLFIGVGRGTSLVRHRLISPPVAQEKREEREVRDEDLGAPLLDELIESCSFLLSDHMPLTIIVSTVTFPIVIGLGGMLTAGTDWTLFVALTVLPSLCVLGLIGGVGRKILLEACDGMQDPPALPSPFALIKDGATFLRDAAVLAAVFFGPCLIATFVPGVGWPFKGLLALAGVAVLPIAMAMRQTAPDRVELPEAEATRWSDPSAVVGRTCSSSRSSA